MWLLASLTNCSVRERCKLLLFGSSAGIHNLWFAPWVFCRRKLMLCKKLACQQRRNNANTDVFFAKIELRTRHHYSILCFRYCVRCEAWWGKRPLQATRPDDAVRYSLCMRSWSWDRYTSVCVLSGFLRLGFRMSDYSDYRKTSILHVWSSL